MRHIVRGIAICASFVAIQSVAYSQNDTHKSFNAILVGWDGAQRDHVRECLQRGELPNLQKLISEGGFLTIDIEGTTDTKAGWTQILTGYNPDKTGVYSNTKYGAIPEGYTVFERLEAFFGRGEFVTVAVVGKKGNIGVQSERTVPMSRLKEPRRKKLLAQAGVSRVRDNNREFLLIPAQPFAKTKDAMDVFMNGLTTNDAVGAKTLELLARYGTNKFFFFVHFAESDHQGHLFGENSKEYNDALISEDMWLGRILSKLKALGLYEATRVYVTADHGFDEGQKRHHNAPYVFLATNDADLVGMGKRVDIAPTILARFGVDLSTLQPPLDGHSLVKTR